LALLREQHPGRTFALLMGMDNLESLPRWRNPEAILQHHQLLVYPRMGVPPAALASHPAVTLLQAPILELSSTHIRAMLAAGTPVRHMLPAGLYDYLVRERFYCT